MNRESLAKMRLDRRLLRRRGWISQKDLEQAVADLPDVGSKATTLGEASQDDDAPSQPAGGESPPSS